MMTALQGAIVGFGMDRPRLVMLLTVLITIALAAAILRVDVDTDPENMLPSDDPVRELNRSIKADFGTRDMIALGVINDDGVLTSNHCGLPVSICAVKEVVDEKRYSTLRFTGLPLPGDERPRDGC